MRFYNESEHHAKPDITYASLITLENAAQAAFSRVDGFLYWLYAKRLRSRVARSWRVLAFIAFLRVRIKFSGPSLSFLLTSPELYAQTCVYKYRKWEAVAFATASQSFIEASYSVTIGLYIFSFTTSGKFQCETK